MSSQNSVRQEIRRLWETTSYPVKYLAYHYDLTEQSVRSIVTGLQGPTRKKKTLSAYHRNIGMLLIDKRIASKLSKPHFAQTCGMSHFRLLDLERGYDEIKITEIIRAKLMLNVAALDTTLLEAE